MIGSPEGWLGRIFINIFKIPLNPPLAKGGDEKLNFRFRLSGLQVTDQEQQQNRQNMQYPPARLE